MRKVLLALVFLLPPFFLSAQTRKADPEQEAFWAKLKAIRQRGTVALVAEQARIKLDLCSRGDSTYSFDQCLLREFQKTDANYTEYVRSIGAILRLRGPGETTPSPAQSAKLPLDAGEEAWLKFREQGCRSVSSVYEGGSQAPIAYSSCRLTITQHHMRNSPTYMVIFGIRSGKKVRAISTMSETYKDSRKYGTTVEVMKRTDGTFDIVRNGELFRQAVPEPSLTDELCDDGAIAMVS